MKRRVIYCFASVVTFGVLCTLLTACGGGGGGGGGGAAASYTSSTIPEAVENLRQAIINKNTTQFSSILHSNAKFNAVSRTAIVNGFSAYVIGETVCSNSIIPTITSLTMSAEDVYYATDTVGVCDIDTTVTWTRSRSNADFYYKDGTAYTDIAETYHYKFPVLFQNDRNSWQVVRDEEVKWLWAAATDYFTEIPHTIFAVDDDPDYPINSIDLKKDNVSLGLTFTENYSGNWRSEYMPGKLETGTYDWYITFSNGETMGYRRTIEAELSSPSANVSQNGQTITVTWNDDTSTINGGNNYEIVVHGQNNDYLAKGISQATNTVDFTLPAGEVYNYTALEIQDFYMNKIYRGTSNDPSWGASESDWNVTTIDTFAASGWGDCSIAVDSSDNPHIAYSGGNDSPLKYASYNASWQTETVYSAGFVEYKSLAINSAGNPCISFNNFSPSQLMYTYNNGSWQTETVAVNIIDRHVSLALDNADNPHLSYYALVGNNLGFAEKNGAWNIETVVAGDFGKYSSLVLDSAGNPHISYYDGAGNTLNHAWNDGSWHTEEIDNWGDVGKYNSLAIDSSDNLFVSYYDTTNSCLKYAEYSGVWGWQVITLDDASAGNTSIAIDSNNNPHIVFFDNGNLKYVSYSGFWQTETIDSSGNVGFSCSLAIDSTDKAHISYYDGINRSILYALEQD